MSIILNEQEMSCAEKNEVGYYENILKDAGVRFL